MAAFSSAINRDPNESAVCSARSDENPFMLLVLDRRRCRVRLATGERLTEVGKDVNERRLLWPLSSDLRALDGVDDSELGEAMERRRRERRRLPGLVVGPMVAAWCRGACSSRVVAKGVDAP